MKRKNILIRLYSFLVLITACTSKDGNKYVLEQVTERLTESNVFIKNSNSQLLDVFQVRSKDSRTLSKAELWQPKALKVQSFADNLISYLDSVKIILNKRNEDRSANRSIVKTLFITEGQGSRLYQKLNDYKTELKNVDATINKEILSPTFLIGKAQNSVGNPAQFAETFFASSTIDEAKAFLNNLQNIVLQSENKCLVLLLQKTTPESDNYHVWPEAVVAQNAQILKTSSELEISAGIASFQKLRGAKVMVGNDNVSLNDKGLAFYKFKTAKRPGRYAIPVKIEFEDEDGKTQTRTFSVQYSLVDTLRKH